MKFKVGDRVIYTRYIISGNAISNRTKKSQIIIRRKAKIKAIKKDGVVSSYIGIEYGRGYSTWVNKDTLTINTQYYRNKK